MAIGMIEHHAEQRGDPVQPVGVVDLEAGGICLLWRNHDVSFALLHAYSLIRGCARAHRPWRVGCVHSRGTATIRITSGDRPIAPARKNAGRRGCTTRTRDAQRRRLPRTGLPEDSPQDRCPTASPESFAIAACPTGRSGSQLSLPAPHPAFAAHFNDPIHDDPALETASFGSDEADISWEWGQRRSELSPKFSIAGLMGTDAAELATLVDQMSGTSYLDQAAIARRAAFTLLRLIGHLSQLDRETPLRCIDYEITTTTDPGWLSAEARNQLLPPLHTQRAALSPRGTQSTDCRVGEPLWRVRHTAASAN